MSEMHMGPMEVIEEIYGIIVSECSDGSVSPLEKFLGDMYIEEGFIFHVTPTKTPPGYEGGYFTIGVAWNDPS